MLNCIVMFAAVKHSIEFDVSGKFTIFLEIKFDLELIAEFATHVDVLVLEAIVMKHVRIEAELKADIIENVNEFTYQVSDCRKD